MAEPINMGQEISQRVKHIADSFSLSIMDTMNQEAERLPEADKAIAGSAQQIALTHQLALYLVRLSHDRGESLDSLLEGAVTYLRDSAHELDERIRNDQ